MSISPTDDKVPASSSSSAPPRILVSPHGSSAEQQGLLELEACVAGSASIRAAQSAADAGTGVFDTGVPIPGDYCNSSQKVNGSRKQDAKKVSYGQRSATSEKWQSTDGISASPKRSDQLRSAQLRGKHSGYVCARPDQMDTSNSQNNVVHSGGRRNQPISGNHLLNFHFDPITRLQPRMAPPKRQQKIRPYNKDLFLQANYNFFLLDTGDYVIGSMDPDKMLQWEDVICVRYSTPFQVHCPICLEDPISAQITSCGHIYCFPCILQYLLMGEEDHQGDYWKKCPLCFMMISIKDLYTVFIDNVKAYNVGDHINFTLLTRTKDSSAPRQRNYQRQDTLSCSSYELSDSFSKFTLTSDVDLSVREAKQDLSEWLAKAESGLVDDLEKLPYVCAALEQLDQRIKNWAEHRSLSHNPSLSSMFPGSPLSMASADKIPPSASVASVNVEQAHSAVLESSVCKNFIVKEDVQDSFQVAGQAHLLPTSSNDNRAIQKQSFGCKDADERDSYFFYQAIDGQHVILHPLNMKCLLHHYKSYESLPDSIDGRIVQLETVTQSEAARKRYRFLSHFSLTTNFQLCEIDLSDVLPANSLSPYADEIKKREKQRKRLARKEQEEKDRSEAVAFQEMPISHDYRRFSCNGATFSLDDFEALGNSAVPSTSPPTIGEKKLFSHVTRLGFASGHDSPALRANVADVPGNVGVSGEGSTVAGQRATTLSFASVTSAAKTISPPEAPRMDGLGKKGKKPTRVLMSTTGGRRY